MENTTLSLKDVLNNMMDALQRAQERLKELGEVSPDLDFVTDDMLLVDDMEKSIDECESLYERINSALVFATYAGQKTVALHRDGLDDPFEFGPDGFEMREKYWDWANEFGVWPKDDYYEELEGFFEEKMAGLMEKPTQIKLPENCFWFALNEEKCVSVWYAPDEQDGDRFQMKIEKRGEDGSMGPHCEVLSYMSYETADVSFEALCETLHEVCMDAGFTDDKKTEVFISEFAKEIFSAYGLKTKKTTLQEQINSASTRKMDSYVDKKENVKELGLQQCKKIWFFRRFSYDNR